VEMWQDFRAAYSKSVIFGTGSVDSTFKSAADQIKTVVGG
jgi:hypothetical protein